MQPLLYFFVAAFALVGGLSGVHATGCLSGTCDTLPNGDFGLGRIFFEKNHKIVKDYDATIEVIPGTPKHVVENLGAEIEVHKNLLLMAADAGTKGKFFSKKISVPKQATLSFKFTALVPASEISGDCRVVGSKDVEYHKVLFSGLKTGQWVDYSYDVPSANTNRVARLECSIEASSKSSTSIIFKSINLCVSFGPGKGIPNGVVSKNLLNYDKVEDVAKDWKITPGVVFTPRINGDSSVVFSKTSVDEKIERIFLTSPNRVYSLSGTVNDDIAYLPFKIYVNNKISKPMFRAASMGVDAVGTQFHVQISSPGKELNITIVRDKKESVERIIRPLALYIHGCMSPKPKARRSVEIDSVHDEF